MIESALMIQKNVSEALSTQQMIDCAQNGNSGCKGGDTCLLLQWLTEKKIQIETETEYPTTNDANVTCKVTSSSGANDTKFYVINDYTCDK